MIDELNGQLDAVVREIRPAKLGKNFSVIAIANRLGVEVTLRSGTTYKNKRRACLIYAEIPEILIYRPAKTRTSLRLSHRDEHTLTTAERFSVAHELGHWIAHARFGVEPLIPGSHRNSEYWRHERTFNNFAGCLLVPDWQVDTWLEERPIGSLITVLDLNRWSRSINVSRINAATRICQYRGGIGFLELLINFDRRTRQAALVVTESASGHDARFPNRHKIIRNDRLLERLKKKSATDLLRGLSFDGKTTGNYYVNWQKDSFRYTKQDPHDPWLNQYIWTSWAMENVIDLHKDSLL